MQKKIKKQFSCLVRPLFVGNANKVCLVKNQQNEPRLYYELVVCETVDAKFFAKIIDGYFLVSPDKSQKNYQIKRTTFGPRKNKEELIKLIAEVFDLRSAIEKEETVIENTMKTKPNHGNEVAPEIEIEPDGNQILDFDDVEELQDHQLDANIEKEIERMFGVNSPGFLDDENLEDYNEAIKKMNNDLEKTIKEPVKLEAKTTSSTSHTYSSTATSRRISGWFYRSLERLRRAPSYKPKTTTTTQTTNKESNDWSKNWSSYNQTGNGYSYGSYSYSGPTFQNRIPYELGKLTFTSSTANISLTAMKQFITDVENQMAALQNKADENVKFNMEYDDTKRGFPTVTLTAVATLTKLPETTAPTTTAPATTTTPATTQPATNNSVVTNKTKEEPKQLEAPKVSTTGASTTGRNPVFIPDERMGGPTHEGMHFRPYRN